jgi:hypothetical protein
MLRFSNMEPWPADELLTSIKWLDKNVPLTDEDALETVTYRVTGTIPTLTVLFQSRPHPEVAPHRYELKFFNPTELTVTEAEGGNDRALHGILFQEVDDDHGRIELRFGRFTFSFVTNDIHLDRVHPRGKRVG